MNIVETAFTTDYSWIKLTVIANNAVANTFIGVISE